MVSKTRHFSISEAIIYGVGKTKEHLSFFISSFTLVIISYLFLSVIAQSFNDTAPFLSLLLSLGVKVLGLLYILGLMKAGLLICENKKPRMVTLISEYRLLPRFIGGAFLYACGVGIGLILLVVPGIIWSIQYRFFPFFMLEDDKGVFDALKASSQMTEGLIWKLFVFYLCLITINIVGALFFLVGIFATIPVSLLATVHVYKKLSSK